jgi:LPXTG-motif cell wall-anchored protein
MRAIRSAVVTAALAFGLVAVAAPAQAAPPALPEGERLVAASCWNLPYPDVTLFEVDSATGVSNALAADTVNSNYCGYQGAWDRVTELFYFTTWDSSESVLLSWDPETAVITEIGTIAEGDVFPNAYALVIDLEGNAYFNDYNDLYSLDLTTGEATLVGELTAVTASGWGFSVDPVTGDLYLLEQDGDLFLVDPDAVTATYVASWPFSDDGDYAYGLAIDGAGTAWVVESPGADSTYSALWSTPLASFGDTTELSGNIVDSATEGDFSGWWVSLIPAAVAPPAPQLAATGVDATPAIAAAAAVLGLGGILLLARRRRSA